MNLDTGVPPKSKTSALVTIRKTTGHLNVNTNHIGTAIEASDMLQDIRS